MLTMGSLFDGIGGFPLAGRPFGIKALWASEIEPFAIEVTKRHFPDMIHLGDITQLNGADLPPVDIITGGSPCQGLSVAGARLGLEDVRSGLFLEQIRIIKEMRNADRKRGRTADAVRPRYAVWENVVGSLSCSDGDDFETVLQSFIQIEEPHFDVLGSEARRWEYAGVLLGVRSSLAYVTWSAEYFGVPQRRRRIFLVADLAGYSPIQVLFDQDSLQGDSEEIEGAWETFANRIGASAAGAGGPCAG